MNDDDAPIDEDGAPVPRDVADGPTAGGDEPPGAAPAASGAVSWRSIVGAAAVVLVVNGVLLFTLATFPLLDPDATRCALARDQIEQANDDDESFNDVDLDGVDVGDLDCDDATALAEAIPTDEDGDDTVSLPSAGGVRIESAVAGLVGVLQVAGGLLVLRRGQRWCRNLAGAAAAAGVIFPIIGLASLMIVGFVVFAMFFSNQARATWPRGR